MNDHLWNIKCLVVWPGLNQNSNPPTPGENVISQFPRELSVYKQAQQVSYRDGHVTYMGLIYDFNPLVVLFPSVELNDNILTYLCELFCSLRKWRHPKAGEAQHGDKKVLQRDSLRYLHVKKKALSVVSE